MQEAAALSAFKKAQKKLKKTYQDVLPEPISVNKVCVLFPVCVVPLSFSLIFAYCCFCVCCSIVCDSVRVDCRVSPCAAELRQADVLQLRAGRGVWRVSGPCVCLAPVCLPVCGWCVCVSGACVLPWVCLPVSACVWLCGACVLPLCVSV